MDGHDGGHGGDLGVGHGHSDIGGHDFGMGHSHGGHNDGHDGHHDTVASEALMVSHSHSSNDGMQDFNTGDMFGPGLDIGQMASSSTADGGVNQREERAKRYKAAVEKAKNDPSRRYYGAHIVGHGHADIPELFRQHAVEVGMVRICNSVANFNPVDLTGEQVSDWSFFTPPYSRKNTPCGYYPGAPGLTRVFKQYWQVAEKKEWWQTGKAKYDRTKSTYIEVSIVTWFYGEVGDYETRVDLNVVSVPVLDRWDKIWARRRTPLEQHQKAALQLCEKLFKSLKLAVPSARVLERRSKILDKKAEEARIAAEQKKPRRPQVGQSGADLDTLFDDAPLEKSKLDPQDTPAPVVVAPSADRVTAEQTEAASAPAVVKADGPTAVDPVAEADLGKVVMVPVTIPPPRLKRTDNE